MSVIIAGALFLTKYSANNNSIKIDIEKIDELYRTAELQIRETFELLNMKKTAEEKTELMVRQMCRNMGFKIVEIEFDTTKTDFFKL